MLALAVVKAVEVIGEAARGVSEATRDALPEIPWKQVIGMRHRLVHDYAEINYDIVWRVVTADLPPLIVRLEAALEAR